MAQYFCVVGVSKDEPGFLGQHGDRKVRIDRPEESVAPGQIALPFRVGAEVGAARLALHHPDLAPRPQCSDVHAQPRCGHELGQAGEAVPGQMPRHSACQPLAGGVCREGDGDGAHGSNMNGW